MILPQGSINSSVLCHNIVQRVLDHLEILKTPTLVYNMGGTLLIWSNNQEMISMLEVMVRNKHLRAWEVTPQWFRGLHRWSFNKPMVLGMPGYLLQNKGQTTVPCSFYHYKGSTLLTCPFLVQGLIFYTCEYSSKPHALCHKNLSALEGAEWEYESVL